MNSLIEIYPKFIHFDSSQEFNATIELKGYYNEIILYIENECNLILIGRKNF
jgi:hypothetical protein